ncbi:hypothetical protein [uncultured Methylobacterium sp.]|jgi:hypothetical protein|uniref:hypothetical protein n=1 Tax=uncultured Methylobacterium sp. TaxID=157278 RepID=UPI002613EAA9|nr:hypothetical protein [uncultured Methylobacterium sp.]
MSGFLPQDRGGHEEEGLTMRFSEQWREEEDAYEAVTFTLEELQAAAAATGLDVQDFRGMHVFRCLYDAEESRIDADLSDPKAVAYMEPLVKAALRRRDVAHARGSAWRVAKRQGWQVLDAAGAPVPEPEIPGGNW